MTYTTSALCWIPFWVWWASTDIKYWLWCIFSVLLCTNVVLNCFSSLSPPEPPRQIPVNTDPDLIFQNQILRTRTHKHAHPVTDPKGTVSLGDRSFVELFIRHLLSASSWKRWGLFPCVALPRTTGRRQETFHSATKVRWMTTLSYRDTREGRRQS